MTEVSPKSLDELSSWSGIMSACYRHRVQFIYLEVLHKSLKESYKVLRSANISRDGFFKKIVR